MCGNDQNNLSLQQIAENAIDVLRLSHGRLDLFGTFEPDSVTGHILKGPGLNSASDLGKRTAHEPSQSFLVFLFRSGGQLAPTALRKMAGSLKILPDRERPLSS